MINNTHFVLEGQRPKVVTFKVAILTIEMRMGFFFFLLLSIHNMVSYFLNSLNWYNW